MVAFIERQFERLRGGYRRVLHGSLDYVSVAEDHAQECARSEALRYQPCPTTKNGAQKNGCGMRALTDNCAWRSASRTGSPFIKF